MLSHFHVRLSGSLAEKTKRGTERRNTMQCNDVHLYLEVSATEINKLTPDYIRTAAWTLAKEANAKILSFEAFFRGESENNNPWPHTWKVSHDTDKQNIPWGMMRTPGPLARLQ